MQTNGGHQCQKHLLVNYLSDTFIKSEKKDEKPEVINSAIHAVPMNDLEKMKNGINDLYALVAQESLKMMQTQEIPRVKRHVR